MTSLEALDRFYRLRVPEQFNRTLELQTEAAAIDPEAARVLEEMKRVRAAVVVEVEVDAPDGHRVYAFEIDEGRMRRVESPARAPFLVLGHSIADFDALRRECGESLLGFLGALAGQGDALRLTSRRVRTLRELGASLALERKGPAGFFLLARFGLEAPEPTPRSIIRLDEKTFAALRRGELDPEEAFLGGRVEIEGDEELAIRLALAAASPD